MKTVTQVFAVGVALYLGPFALVWPERVKSRMSRAGLYDPDMAIRDVRFSAIGIVVLALFAAWRSGLFKL